ncbi:MAG TPA: hypothetical protein ENI73_08055, partial [Spirochaetes bacterium]|nr:hypothetical protein [Spirochaetota bacterium]
DKIKLANGTELNLVTKFDPANHAPVVGTLVGLPTKLYFNKKDISKSMEWETKMELEKGDTVYMQYLSVLVALADKFNPAASYPDPTWFTDGKDIYVIINYSNIYFAIRGEKLIPVNGYCIARPILKKEKEYEGILIPKYLKKKKSNKWAEIMYVGERCTDFVDKRMHDIGKVSKGDVVLFGAWSNQRVEYSLHQTFFKEAGEYVVIQRKWMKAMLPNNMKERIESGDLE